VKRAIYVDQSSVRFLDDAEIAKLARIHLLTDYVERRAADIARWNAENAVDLSALPNGRRMTNLGTFRAYLETFLEHHPRVRQDLPLLVRQLAPTPEGLPLEIYCYVVDTTFVVYEKLQADLFDHALAVIPEFGLRVFQRPSGLDVRHGAGDPRRP
jgi:miniconductance mechanosensitive channel